jgi:hypothetical protein
MDYEGPIKFILATVTAGHQSPMRQTPSNGPSSSSKRSHNTRRTRAMTSDGRACGWFPELGASSWNGRLRKMCRPSDNEQKREEARRVGSSA